MKHFVLEVEHQYKNRFVGRHKIRPRGVKVLGSSRDADVRLLGDDVSQIHAYIEFQDGAWHISDAGTEHGTWVSKKPIVNEAIKEATTVVIGSHTLKLTPHESEKEIFSEERMKESSTKGAHVYHQVIVRKGDATIRSELLNKNATYEFLWQGKSHPLPPPKGQEAVTTVLGAFTIVQRIVKSDTMTITSKDMFSQLRSPEMRAPLTVAAVLLLILATLIVAIPQKPTDEMEDLKLDNKYTRMIYDAQVVKKAREQAKEMRKTIQAKAPAQQQQPKNTLNTAAKPAANQPKVISKLKMEGLSALIGKISKRANANGPMLAAFGRTPDSLGTSGIATVAAVGSLQGVATKAGSGGGTYKVGNVGTAGKGGGSSVGGIGGLATGGAGSGTVGILDEETEIEGGLDKEVIAKVIANYLGEVRYCYERQLSAEPDIYGKVQVKFTIDGSGNVSEQRVGLTTLNSAMVEGCILRRLARWKFPKPKGGTQVLVSYPFMFKATN